MLFFKFVNERFSDDVENIAAPVNFSEHWLTCNVRCLVCK